MKKKIVPIVIAIALAAAVATFWRQHETTSPDDANGIAYGNVDIREVSLSFRVGGRVAEMLVEEGDAVQADQALARLDDQPYRIALAAAHAQLQQAQAKLSQLQAGFRPEEIDQAEATVAERVATLDQAGRMRDRQRQLHEAKVGTDEALDAAESAYETAEARLSVARSNLALMRAGYRSEEIDQAKAAVAQAKANVEQAELQIADTSLTAPSPGVVLTRAVEPGAMVGAGQAVLSLSLQDKVWARAYVSENQLPAIHPGLEVAVHIDGVDTPYSGHVGFISPKAEFTPKNVETTELRSSLVYRFRVVIDKPDNALRQGMPVSVTWNAREKDK